MAIAYSATGGSAAGTTSCTPGYPSVAAGNFLCMLVSSKYPTNSPATPSGGWIAPAHNEYTGGHGVSGVDTGSVTTTWFIKIADGTETGTVTVNVGSGNSCRASIYCFTNATGYWSYDCAGGAFNTPGTAWSVTADRDPGILGGDRLIVGSTANADTYTVTVESATCSGITFGTKTERSDVATTNGDDLRHIAADIAVTSGTSSGVTTYTQTMSGTDSIDAPAGSSVILRMREEQPALVGTSAGIATAAATAVGSYATVGGSSAGVATAAATLAALAGVVGSSAGVATATGVSNFITTASSVKLLKRQILQRHILPRHLLKRRE